MAGVLVLRYSEVSVINAEDGATCRIYDMTRVEDVKCSADNVTGKPRSFSGFRDV